METMKMNLETTKNKMPKKARIFFDKLQNYLDTKVYYYGSIQRFDYLPECSDIDAAIFTDNFESTILKLQNFLNVKKKDSFKKFIIKLDAFNNIAFGYKIKYEDKDDVFTAEIAIYNVKDKKKALEEQITKCDIPNYVSFLLYILKNLYYRFHVLPFNVFFSLKKFCLNELVNGKDSEYIIL
jgi:hypothetical protein